MIVSNRDRLKGTEETKDAHTVDPFAVRVAQEHDNLGNVVWDGASAEGNEFGNASLNLLQRSLLGGARGVVPGVLGEHVGLDTARGDGVGGDTLGTTVGSKRTGETLDSGLGTSIQSMVRDAQTSSDGGHEDNTAALWNHE